MRCFGFGYPAKKPIGKKNRLPLDQIAFHEKYGDSISNLVIFTDTRAPRSVCILSTILS